MSIKDTIRKLKTDREFLTEWVIVVPAKDAANLKALADSHDDLLKAAILAKQLADDMMARSGYNDCGEKEAREVFVKVIVEAEKI